MCFLISGNNDFKLNVPQMTICQDESKLGKYAQRNLPSVRGTISPSKHLLFEFLEFKNNILKEAEMSKLCSPKAVCLDKGNSSKTIVPNLISYKIDFYRPA